MAKFDAAVAVEAIDFDFTKYGGPAGTVPEPSQGQVEAFFKRIADVQKFARSIESGARKAESEGEESMDEFIQNLPEDELRKMQAEMSSWVSEVCSNFPATEDVERLPYRIFSAFVKFISSELGPKGTNGSTA